MDDWFGYLILQNLNLTPANFLKLVIRVNAILSRSALSHHLLRRRVSIDQTEVLYRCFFPIAAIQAQTIAGWMAESVFDVNPSLVTFTTGKTTLLARPTVFATYKYNGVNRVRVGLFGCENAATLCTLEESKLEAVQYIDKMYPANWHEVEVG